MSFSFFSHSILPPSQPPDCGCDCKPMTVNNHFSHLLYYAPSGLCCPSRRAMILRSPDGVVPESYAGGAILQDSKDSIAVSASLDPSLFGDYDIIQMHMYAFQKATNCPGKTNCTLNDFFMPGTSIPRTGNVFSLLASNIFPAAGPFTMSSFSGLPLGSMQNSIGYEIHICFVNQGTSQGASPQVLYSRLYAAGSLSRCQYPAVFPARETFGV